MPASYLRASTLAALFVVAASFGPVRAQAQNGFEDDGSGNINIVGVGGTVRIEDDGSGSIDVNRVAGDFIVRSAGSGGITHDTVKGTVSIPEGKRRGT